MLIPEQRALECRMWQKKQDSPLKQPLFFRQISQNGK